MLRLFSKTSSKTTEYDTKLIQNLIRVKISNYNVKVMKEILGDIDMSSVNDLIKCLSKQVIEKISHLKRNPPSTFYLKWRNFRKILDELMRKHPYVILSYAAKLLQYYTLISDKSLTKAKSFKSFHDELIIKKISYGHRDNPFMIYHEIIMIQKDLKNSQKLSYKELDFILNNLFSLEKNIDHLLINLPDNLFIFSLNHRVKTTIVNFLSLKILDEKSDLKEKYKKLSEDAYQNLIELTNYFIERRETPKGLEFDLTQDLESLIVNQHEELGCRF